jgi:hypothetical protein
VRSFQKEACSLVAEVIDSIPKDEQDISTVTFLSIRRVYRFRESLAAIRRGFTLQDNRSLFE